MAAGEFTDREEALAAVDRLLAADAGARLLMVFGVTGQGKTRLLERITELHWGNYRPQMIDLQSVVQSLRGIDETSAAYAVDDVAVLMLRAVGTALAHQARWWQRPRRLARHAVTIGQDPIPRQIEQSQSVTNEGILTSSAQNVYIGVSPVDTVRRGTWISQLEEIARRLRRRRLLLLFDTCEWMYVFDEAPPHGQESQEAARPGPLGLSPWFLGQVLPRLLAAAPRLKAVLAGWDRLEGLSTRQVHALACELTGWSEGHTRSFLASAGIEDPAVAALVHEAGDGLPLLADVVATKATEWRTIDGAADVAALTALIRDQPSQQWVPRMILARLSPHQQNEIAAATVLRTVTRPALEALLDEVDSTGADWFRRLTSRAFLHEPPPGSADPALAGQGWRMHGQIRRWLLDYLTDTDATAPTGRQRLPLLHGHAASYFQDLASREPDGDWSLELAYHCFAVGDDSPAPAWQRRMLVAAHAGNLAVVAAHADIALAREQRAVRTLLPAVAAPAAACAAWVAYLRGVFTVAERVAVDAADLYRQVNQPTGQAWALQLAGQAAWKSWCWANAISYWRQALDLLRGHGGGTNQLALTAALAGASLACGDYPAVGVLVAEAETLSYHTPTGPPGRAPEVGDPAIPPHTPLADAVPANRMAGYLSTLIAHAALKTNDWDQAEDLLLQTEQRVRDGHDQLGLVEVLRLRAELARYRNQTPASAQLAREAGDVLLGASAPSALRVAVLLTQAAAARRLSRYGPPPTLSSGPLSGVRPTVTLLLSEASESRHQLDLAQRYARAALDVALDIGDRHGQANAHDTLGDFALPDDHGAAAEHCTVALTLYQQIGDRLGQANAHLRLGWAALFRADHGAAAEHCTVALTLYQQIGDRLGQADAHFGLGEVARLRDDYGAAGKHYTVALTLYQQIGVRLGQANAHLGLGAAARLRDDYGAAGKHYTVALTLCQQIGDRLGQADAHFGLGEAARLRSDSSVAEERYTVALTLYQQIGVRLGQANAHLGLGAAALLRGDSGVAEKHCTVALTLYQQIGDRLGQANAGLMLGETALMQGDNASARKWLMQSAELYETIGRNKDAAHAREQVP
jgi:tetratricopeptide (TPR) repeat protein